MAPHLATGHKPAGPYSHAMKPPSLPRSSQRTTVTGKASRLIRASVAAKPWRSVTAALSRRLAGRAEESGKARPPCPFPRGRAGPPCPLGCRKSQGKTARKAPSPRHRGDRSVSRVKEEREARPFLSFPFA